MSIHNYRPFINFRTANLQLLEENSTIQLLFLNVVFKPLCYDMMDMYENTAYRMQLTRLRKYSEGIEGRVIQDTFVSNFIKREINYQLNFDFYTSSTLESDFTPYHLVKTIKILQ